VSDVRIVVPIKQVPDLVEELELAPDGTDIDREYLKFVLNEFDDQALEQALLLKESAGGELVVVGFDEPEVDLALHTALAKGADRAVKLTGAGDGWISGHARAAALAAWLQGQEFDLVVTGVQAADDLDGQLAPLLAPLLGVPHVSVVIGVEVSGGTARVTQDLSGGKTAVLEVKLPAVLGVQAAEQPPRYAPIGLVRQAMKERELEEAPVEAPAAAGLTVRRLAAPEKTGRAEMLNGGADGVADRIVELIRERGLLKG
jgi:electron transfer flavoprotein beta subunit